jgi:hypothetical protein
MTESPLIVVCIHINDAVRFCPVNIGDRCQPQYVGIDEI